MSFTVYPLLLKIRATMAAADSYCTAVVTREPFAALVSFLRQQASIPLTQKYQFSGNDAICDRR